MVEKLIDIIDLFCSASGMKINIAKLKIYLWGLTEGEKNLNHPYVSL
jgi:hypothetical protein